VALEIVRFSGKALTEGVETHCIEGVPVRITNAARTVADCFKYRNKIGQDIALEALRDSLRDRKANASEISRFAKFDRVWRIIRPYLEATI
jgi:predicted transcriptional regulator of viral defense system